MGGLAHFIEETGIATTQISLIRLHTEKMQPPRALWVPYELGRPFGIPDDPAFQHRVLKAALNLLDAESGPLIDDHLEEAPASEAEDMDGWVCPMPVRAAPETAQEPAAKLIAEIASLRQWHHLFREQRQRTTVGVCPMDLDDIARYLCAMLASERPAAPPENLSQAQVLKLGSEDLKAFYFEAALAMPGDKSARQIDNWLWTETELGKTLLALKPVCLASDDAAITVIGQVLMVPHHRAH